MASLSLPRVLQQRKTSLEIERENFEKCQATAISKAVNHLETPLKQKHVRSTIIGTFHEKGAQTFWIVSLRLPLQEDRIVAWKFCHVLHKILREGYPTTIQHSLRHRDELANLGKLWVHLKDCYGRLIHLYCNLLMTKLDFHRRNPRFPGNLSVTHSELESIGENDINNYFQMSVEMFDYMDNILELQVAIFGSIDRSRSNSMTSSGQCRLSPLIPCIQDASRLYDFCVKILFKLHSALPADTLSGHRDRFLKQFRELKLFYQNSNALQYFRNLITIPALPENPPNFLIQAELRTYVTPVVIIPPEEPEEPLVVEGTLVDTSHDLTPPTPDSVDSMSVHSGQNGSNSPFQQQQQQLMELIGERDGLIEHLQQENKHLRSEAQKLSKEYQKQISNLQEQVTAVETELATRESELVQERQLKEDLFHQAAATAQNQDSEQKLKEEKFTKLKEVYTKLREEHIQLIRQKADVEKKLLGASKVVSELERNKNELQSRIGEMSEQNSLVQEKLQQSANENSLEVQILRKEHDTLTTENCLLNSRVERLTDEKSALERCLDDTKQQKEQLEIQVADLTIQIVALNTNIEKLSKELEDKTHQLLLSCIRESESIISHALEEVENPALSAVTCSPDYFRSLTSGAISALTAAEGVNHSQPNELAVTAVKQAHTLAVYLVQGRATSNTSPDIMFGEQMTEKCKQLGATILSVLQNLRLNKNVSTDVSKAKSEIQAMSELAETLRGTLKENSAELLADLVENELLAMDKNIEEAAKLIQEMLSKSRAADSGIKLEVNEKILDTCTKLMHAIRVLVKKSRLLQAEIVAQGKGSASVKEFYKRNHRWTDGLISAAKAVGTAAGFLLTAADKVVTSQGKLEQLAVAAQEIAASTAQLVVASRVKADRNSNNLQELTQASKSVSSATGEVVATVKNCGLMMDEADEFDATKLTLHAAKRLEMDTQIRVLELEKELEQSRTKLSALRRHHYQLAGESEGWVSKTDATFGIEWV